MRKHAVQQPTPRITSEHSRVPGILETAAERGLDEISIFFTHGMGPTDRCFGDEVATMINGLPREGNTCDQRTKVLQVCLGGSFTVRGEAEAESSFHIGRDCLPASGRAAASGQESTYSAFGKLRIERLSRIFRGRPIRIHLYRYWWEEDA